RFAQFYDAIKKNYPQLEIISSVGTTSLGKPNEAKNFVRSRTPDVVDEHFYLNARAMMDNASRYDRYSRTGPKIFVGEWATREGGPTTNFKAALADAAFMTSLERNSDIVVMSCYAPLFVNVNRGAMQWAGD